jgi:formamidopyrimidine-DNA glycosylase
MPEPPAITVYLGALDERIAGQRIAIGADGDLWIMLDLMIAGRLHWRPVWPARPVEQRTR